MRVVEKESVSLRPNSNSIRGHCDSASRAIGQPQRGAVSANTTTTGWQPSCECGGDPIPCTVLDPFGGSGTTGKVALELGRRAILIELNPDYVEMIKRRCRVTVGLPL